MEKVDSVLFEQIRVLLAEIFEVSKQEVNPETQFGDLLKWDSMGHMDLMLALESQFGIEITAQSIGELISIPIILAAIQEKQNA